MNQSRPMHNFDDHKFEVHRVSGREGSLNGCQCYGFR
jgi:hypothetical protein